MRRRVHLPVFLDRRTLLRGAAAALLGSLSGCRIVLDPPQEPGDGRPDATAGPPVAGDLSPGDVSAGDGFARCGDQLCLDLAHPANTSLTAVDGARALTFEGKRLIVIRVSATEVVALSAVCTHTGCTVRYTPINADIECPCHGSTFALDGKVTHGPAARPLALFPATLDPATGILAVAV
jgi:Rieske Fe-S protein